MNSLIFPSYVQKGDRVIILSPSSKIDKSFLKGAQKRLKSWGLEVVMAKHAGSSHGTYGGSINDCSADSGRLSEGGSQGTGNSGADSAVPGDGRGRFDRGIGARYGLSGAGADRD